MKIFEYNSASVLRKYFKLVENRVEIQRGITSLVSASFTPVQLVLYFLDIFILIPPFSVSSCLSDGICFNIELSSVYENLDSMRT
jgi:hypothetical protein